MADKFLPEWRDGLSEPVGAAIANLNRAERLGWIGSMQTRTEVRLLRSRMSREIVHDPAERASASAPARAAMPLLAGAGRAIAQRIMDVALPGPA